MSKAKDEMRMRAMRLTCGEFNPKDVTDLFLFFRHRSYGQAAVMEVGDFIAHREKRDKGLVTQRAKDWFICLRFYALAKNRPFPLDMRPANFPDVLEASFNLLPDQVIRKDTGLNRNNVRKRLKRIREYLEFNKSGGITAEKIVDAKDLSILTCLTGNLGGMQSAFTEEELYSQFRGVLVSQGLLNKEEVKGLSGIRKAISLSAVAAMHYTRIDLGDGTYAELAAMDDVGTGNLGVMATSTVNLPQGEVHFASSVYQTLVRRHVVLGAAGTGI